MANDNENLEIKKNPQELSEEDLKKVSGGLCKNVFQHQKGCIGCADEASPGTVQHD